MPEYIGYRNNADVLTVTFEDVDGTPVDPDDDVTWEIHYKGDNEASIVTQAVSEHVSTGAFELEVTVSDAAIWGYTAKAFAMVGGALQSPPVRFRAVLP